MSLVKYHNVDGSTSTIKELISPGRNIGNVSSIVICNTNVSSSATVTLYIESNISGQSSQRFNILKSLEIISKSTLFLEGSDIPSFNNSESGYGLYIEVGGSDTLDVLITV